MKNKINVLGTTYTILIKSVEEDERLKDSYGLTDYCTKEIIIADDVNKETDNSCRNLEVFKKKVIRHEIIHAFLCESGLRECSGNTMSWAENEEMIDWFANQSPKIYKVYKELDILGGDDNEK